MKIDSKFLNQQWFRAIAAEFGPDGQIAVIRLPSPDPRLHVYRPLRRRAVEKEMDSR